MVAFSAPGSVAEAFNGRAGELEVPASEAPCQSGITGCAPEVWLSTREALLAEWPLKLGMPLPELSEDGLLSSRPETRLLLVICCTFSAL